MKKEIIHCDSSPAAIGPYSQAVKVDSLVFVSGQIPIDPSSGNLVDGDIKVQTKQVLDNLNNILVTAGSSLEKVIKTTVYMTDLDDYSAMNEVYGTYFNKEFPARAAVVVSELPKKARIEIDAIASA